MDLTTKVRTLTIEDTARAPASTLTVSDTKAAGPTTNGWAEASSFLKTEANTLASSSETKPTGSEQLKIYKTICSRLNREPRKTAKILDLLITAGFKISAVLCFITVISLLACLRMEGQMERELCSTKIR